MINSIIHFCLKNKLIVVLLLIFVTLWGFINAPFDWKSEWLPRDPVPVDAIPDLGENQQIVFTEWKGRSPQDVEDQITYPLTVSLLGVPGVKTIRSYSYFSFSSIYVVFNDDIEFYWSRSRILEKLNSLPAGTLPSEVQPALGPDATALGQIFWYTLEGSDANGKPTGGWDLDELRSIQDWQVRYSLQAAEGVSEVASVGGFVREYQVDVDPNAMRVYNVKLEDIFNAVRQSNIDVGARTIEINRVEYVIRGLGFLKSLDDLSASVIKVNDNTPITIGQVAHVSLGPALRRGVLDKGGAEAVGGVVVVRNGENPLRVIQNVKEKIQEISPGLPKKTLADGTVSQVRIVPFYDRTDLIYETLGTLNTALRQEILITIIVVLLMVNHLRSSVLIAGLLPLAVLMCFILMKLFGVDANIVALSGIAIAIGTMVDMGIVICENILNRLNEASENENKLEVVYQASSEVGGAVFTAVATTIVSFLPVFTMTAAEGKLFQPLAYTKSFALLASVAVALTIIPPVAHWLFTGKIKRNASKKITGFCVMLVSLLIAWQWSLLLGAILFCFGAYTAFGERLPKAVQQWAPIIANGAAVFVVGVFLAIDWLPLGPERGNLVNFLFVALIVGGVIGGFWLFKHFYEPILRWCLDHKAQFLLLPALLVLFGALAWLGADTVFGFLPKLILSSRPFQALQHEFPGLGEEFMPPLDEGSFLFMPTTMPHASIGEAQDVLQTLDMTISAIPEVEVAVGKLGRVDSALDPAPISMYETIIQYKSEYKTDESGQRLRYRFNSKANEFELDENGNLIEDNNGRPFRQWRNTVHSPSDIWDEIIQAARLPGTTSAPKLQPIETRLIMLQTGMRAPMGVKVKGPDLETIEKVGIDIERILKTVPSVKADAVLADRIVGKPYLEIDIDRNAIARYGLSIRNVQDVIEIAIGGRMITQTIEGRERYPVRVRYQRELRDDLEPLGAVIVPTPTGAQIPLRELSEIRYVRGPQMIKSEDTFLVGYVTFDKQAGFAEVDVVNQCRQVLQDKIASGELQLPNGVSYRFAGSYENQVRSAKTLRIVLPLALFAIFLILYLQFSSLSTTALVFSGVLVAWSGGFLMLWLYGQSWFLNVSLFGDNLRHIFQIEPFNLSVAVWVGFLALFGIATDDGVILSTYIQQSFEKRRPETVQGVREAIVQAGRRRIRPCLMTAATTILALLPVLTSTGRGSDVMVPMAIPSFGGMIVVLITVFVVPVLYCWVEEMKIHANSPGDGTA